MFREDGLIGSACGACAWHTASPLRGLVNDLGVQAAVGFCEPAGFTPDGNSENFGPCRRTELQQVRDNTGKLPG